MAFKEYPPHAKKIKSWKKGGEIIYLWWDWIEGIPNSKYVLGFKTDDGYLLRFIRVWNGHLDTKAVLSLDSDYLIQRQDCE